MKYYYKKFLFLVLLPLLLGATIYLLWGVKTLLVFSWLESIGLLEIIDLFRDYFSRYQIPKWFIYNLPDLLWVLSATSFILLVWNGRITKSNSFYTMTPLLAGVGTEIGQKFNLVSGTFDWLDILAYTLGFIFSLLVYCTNLYDQYFKTHH